MQSKADREIKKNPVSGNALWHHIMRKAGAFAGLANDEQTLLALAHTDHIPYHSPALTGIYGGEQPNTHIMREFREKYSDSQMMRDERTLLARFENSQMMRDERELQAAFNVHRSSTQSVTVSSPPDPLEKEADAIANTVVAMTPPVNGVQTKQKKDHGILRKPKHDQEITPDIADTITTLQGGSPLNSKEKEYFESRFNTDFSRVRIHTDNEAADTAEALNARAYTIGNDIVFARGEYRPDTPDGKKLMAHELTHIIQQNGGEKVISRAPYDPKSPEDKKEEVVDRAKLQSLKDIIFHLDPALIDRTKQLTGTTWRDVLLMALTNYSTHQLIKSNESKALNEDLAKHGVSLIDLFTAVGMYQKLALHKADQLIEKTKTVAKEEKERYSTKREDLNNLFTLLTTTYAKMYDEADLLRAKGLIRYMQNQAFSPTSITDLFTGNFRLKTLLLPLLIAMQTVGIKEKDLAKLLAKLPPDAAEIVILQMEMMKPSLTLATVDIEGPIGRIRRQYPEFQEARDIDNKAREQMRLKEAKDFPVLADVFTDYRTLSRKYREKKDVEGFKSAIIEILDNRYESGVKTQQTFKDEPDKVWGLSPLIQVMMEEEQISRTDNIGMLIWDRVEDYEREKMIRSIGLAAIGIALGIAGFFTGGAAWVGIALGVGGAVVSGIDLYLELQEYSFRWNAARATFDSVLTEDPSALGVALAIFGLVLDVVDIAANAAKLIKSVKAVKSATQLADIQKAAKIEFHNLLNAGLIKKGVTEAEFVEKITKAALSDLDAAKQLAKGTQKEFSRLLTTFKLHESPDIMQAGLMRIYNANKKAGEKIIKTFAETPDVLVRLSTHALLDNSIGKSFSKIDDLLGNEAIHVFEYFGREGATTLDTLPGTLKALTQSGIDNKTIIKEILTNQKLHRAVIVNPRQMKEVAEYIFKLASDPAQFRKVFSSLDDDGIKQLLIVYEEGYQKVLSETMKGRYDNLVIDFMNGKLKNFPLDIRLDLLENIHGIRSALAKSLPSDVSEAINLGQRNIAYATSHITLPNGRTISESLLSVSGKGTSNKIINNVGDTFEGRTIVEEVVKKEVKFEAIQPIRFHDSERKIMEHIIAKLKKQTGIDFIPGKSYIGKGFSGNITIYTEMSPCNSCMNILGSQFKKMFGNDIIIDIKYGVDFIGK